VAVSEPKAPPIRKDLEIVPQYYGGQVSYVAKDPITLTYYRLREVEYVVLKCFQKGMAVEQTIREVKKRTDLEISPVAVYRFANQLQSSNLLKSKGMEDVRRLARGRAAARKRRFFQVISNYLFITIPLWDPDRLLSRLLPWFRFLLNPFCAVAWLAITGAALWIVVSNFSVLVADAFSLLSGWNLLMLSVVLFFIKFFHEMGHALTCKHYGGEVHAVGPAFLVLQPCMFTDTTDAWLFPSKWDRVKVSAAGILAEVLIASVAAVVWMAAEPGLVKQVTYTAMVACSVNTVLFNANPLLRFDGYYVLSDVLEIPNLGLKAGQYLEHLFDRYGLGIDSPGPVVQENEKAIFVAYGVARFLYRILIMLAIGVFFYSLFEPLGLLVAVTTAYGLVVGPVWKRGVQLAQQYRSGRVRARYLAILASVVVVLASLWFIPIDYVVAAPCVVAPVRIDAVRAAVRGRIGRIAVRPGQHVTAGQTLVEMDSAELPSRAEQVREQIRATDARLARALASDPANYEIQRTHRKALTEELDQLEKDISRLTLLAPMDGVVVNLHLLEAKTTGVDRGLVQPPEGDAEADLERFEGMTVAAGTGILGVADPEGFLFEAFVYEHDVSHLVAGNPMTCLLRSDPATEFKTHVRSMTPVDVKTIENVGITLADVGYIPVKPSASGQQEPLVTLYLVRSELVPAPVRLPWGLTGKARMTYGAGPAGAFYFDNVVRALRLRLQKVSS
jgi:putative peptide zinc metalloprotease protein